MNFSFSFARVRRWRQVCLAVLIAAACVSVGAKEAKPGSGPKVDFNRDIRPIFSDICFACHGPDDNKRKANLRLDEMAVALKPAKSGAIAVVPGDISKSELI